MPVQASKGSDSETESNEEFPMLNHAAPEVQKIEIVPVAPQEADLDEFEEEEETVEESEVEQAEDAQAAAIEEHAEMPADADMRTAEETDEETPEYREIPIESYEQKGTSEKPIRINSADGQATVPGTSEFAEEEDMSESSSNDLDLPTGIATETASEHERARGRRRVIFVRNAESIENVFPDWIRRGFVTGKYRPYDQNLPLSLPKRTGAPFVFAADSPLTEMGTVMARMIGRQLRAERNLVLISSPALRCVQTARELGTEMANTSDFDAPVPICVEPAVFDYVPSYKYLPCWMRVGELVSEGYPIEQNYNALDPSESCLHRDGETLKEYRRLCRETMLNILDSWAGKCSFFFDGVWVPYYWSLDHGDIVIVTHPVTIDCMMRVLLRKLPPTEDTDKAYPYGRVIVLEQSGDVDRSWRRANNAIPPITCVGFKNAVNETAMEVQAAK